jgi:UMF1 family MFS transporter
MVRVLQPGSAIKACFVIVGIWWTAFTLPLIFLVKEEKPLEPMGVRQAVKKGWGLPSTPFAVSDS